MKKIIYILSLSCAPVFAQNNGFVFPDSLTFDYLVYNSADSVTAKTSYNIIHRKNKKGAANIIKANIFSTTKNKFGFLIKKDTFKFMLKESNFFYDLDMFFDLNKQIKYKITRGFLKVPVFPVVGQKLEDCDYEIMYPTSKNKGANITVNLSKAKVKSYEQITCAEKRYDAYRIEANCTSKFNGNGYPNNKSKIVIWYNSSIGVLRFDIINQQNIKFKSLVLR